VLKNVTKHCRADFPKDEVPGAFEDFQRFMKEWIALIHSPTSDEYVKRLEDFRNNPPAEAVEYCEKT
jgi:hypothetical protein